MEAMQETAHDEFQTKDKLLLKMQEERSKNLAKVIQKNMSNLSKGQTIQRKIGFQGKADK